MIRGMIFDLGWTLMYLKADMEQTRNRAYQLVATFLNANGIDTDENFVPTLHAARARGWKLADETGVERFGIEALAETFAELGYPRPDGLLARANAVLFDELARQWLAYDDALATLQELTQRGLRVGLFSNADDDGLVQGCVARLGFTPYLNPALSSAMPHRLRKPDPRALHLLSDAWQIAPREIVMVGDSPQYDVLGAHRAGMRAILADRADNFWWQKIPDNRANDPALRADATVKALAEVPSVIEKM
jgi:FMN phosphatase YigB (HAD superfamily)